MVETVSALLEMSGLTNPFWLYFFPLFLVKTSFPPTAELLQNLPVFTLSPSRVYQAVKLYLFSTASGGFNCPLAMTDGAAKVIEV